MYKVQLSFGIRRLILKGLVTKNACNNSYHNAFNSEEHLQEI